jgi:hypothetical protein
MRRDTRRAQFQERQLARQRERQRQIRQQRMIRYASIGGGLLVFALMAFLIIHAALGGGAGTTSIPPNGQHTQYTTPANGETREGMQCYSQEQLAYHIHAYLAIYVDGKLTQVPPNTGITATCIYPLHVHPGAGEENIIHVEAPSQQTYTLGQFFAIWGQPLSATQVEGYKADASHSLKFVTIDESGKQTVVTGDPWNIPLTAHETIVILYNSPNVQPTPYTNWNGL